MPADRARAVIEGFLCEVGRILEAAQGRKPTRDDNEKLRDQLESLRNEAARIIAMMQHGGSWRWEETPYADIDSVKRLREQRRPHIVRASIWRLSDVFTDGEQDGITATLADSAIAASIDTTAIFEPLLTDVQMMRRRYAQLDVLGFSMSVLGRYIYVVVDVRPPDTPLRIVRASPADIALAETTLDQLRADRLAPLEYLRTRAVDIVGIRHLRHDTPLHELSRAMVLQALSGGHVGNANGRIHTVVVGHPGGGKKLLVAMARVLNIAFRHASHKVTEAGFVGRASLETGGTYRTAPGLLSLAHEGTLAFEDFHAMTGHRLATILGHVSQFMEDGEVHDATSAMASLQTNTALHLDLNRESDLFVGAATTGDYRRLPLNVLSRADVLHEYPDDPDYMFDVAAEMASRTRVIGPDTRGRDATRARELQLLVALLRERIPEVVVPAGVANAVASYLQEIGERHRALRDVHRRLGGFATRLANSINKLMAASARGHGRGDVVMGDLDTARLHVERKLEALNGVFTQTRARRAGWTNRADAAHEEFGGDDWSAHDYERATGASQPTAYRDIVRMREAGMVEPADYGQYRFLSDRLQLPAPDSESVG